LGKRLDLVTTQKKLYALWSTQFEVVLQMLVKCVLIMSGQKA